MDIPEKSFYPGEKMKDVPKVKDENKNTKKVLEYVNTCQQFFSSTTDYRFFTDSIKELSGAALVGINIVSEEDKSKTIVMAVSGAPEILSRVINTFGSNLEGTEWEAIYKEKK